MLDLDSLSLWPHQRNAVDRLEEYFTSESPQSALVHHPTGAGKTGVMATVARRRAPTGPVLVICPSAALVVQLEQQFAERFWNRIGAADNWKFGHTAQLTLLLVDTVLQTIAAANGEEVAVFATIQALQQIHDSDKYEDLVGVFSTVFFDEGHREPAPQWAQAARNLGAPTVLFSATPYRNDLRIFDVDQEFTSFLSFQLASDEGWIRPVEVSEQPLPVEAQAFARDMIAKRDELLGEGKIEAHHKMIIRADKESEVEALFIAFEELLVGRNDGVLAIHHNFKESGAVGTQRRGDVPANLADRPERFLIHQLKLTEGIDDPACTMLALFSTFSNERQLVQQVGRLTRHPGPLGEVASPAYVFSRQGEGVIAMWDRFLAYDEACRENNGRPPIRDQSVVDRILAALPELDYVDGRFRRRADLSDQAIRAEIRVPRSAIIFEVTPRFNLDAFAAAISDALDEEDRIEQAAGPTEDPYCRYHLSISLRQTPLLASSLFQTASLEITVYALRENRLFFYDTRGLWIDDFEWLDRRVTSRALGSLLPETGGVVTEITLRNTDLGPLALHGRTLKAASVARAGVFLGEHTHVTTRATGKPADRVRRTLGFTSARVRQGEGPHATLTEFSTWCDEVTAELDAAAAPADLFGRFAIAVDTPENTTPRNIFVDVPRQHLWHRIEVVI